jgi:hypothetical protein
VDQAEGRLPGNHDRRQLMTLALAVIIPLSMLLYSNSRITEAKETLRAEMQKGFSEINASLERITTHGEVA